LVQAEQVGATTLGDLTIGALERLFNALPRCNTTMSATLVNLVTDMAVLYSPPTTTVSPSAGLGVGRPIAQSKLFDPQLGNQRSPAPFVRPQLMFAAIPKGQSRCFRC
jgi:hypothetical protein